MTLSERDILFFKEQGYLVVDLKIGENLRSEIARDIAELIESDTCKLNPLIYHYNEHPRVIEGWKKSPAVKRLALDSSLLSILRDLEGDIPLPFSTINFTYGTEQPLHSDYVHFGSFPELRLSGVWIALEDIHPDAGPLSVVPGSHRFPIFRYEDHGLETFPPENVGQIKANYTFYEEWVKATLLASGTQPVSLPIRAGEAIIWSANLLHGATKILDRGRTRRSQVIHYHYKSCDFFYNPTFSTRDKFVKRDVYSSEIC